MTPRDLSFNDIAVGMNDSFERTISEEDVRAFSILTGDENPLHMDETYAATTKFGRRLVHGMFVASLTSTLVGMYLPGKRCLYLREHLDFKKPVFIGDTVSVRGEVIQKSDATGILEIAVSITKGDETVVEGTATVQVL
ncbi:MAG: MaoC family dehydratase [Patescibacteria group bacterium]